MTRDSLVFKYIATAACTATFTSGSVSVEANSTPNRDTILENRLGVAVQVYTDVDVVVRDVVTVAVLDAVVVWNDVVDVPEEV